MASYLTIALLVCLQITGCLCAYVPGWQIAVLVLFSVTLFILLIGFLVMIACRMKGGCGRDQNCGGGGGGGGVYLQNMGGRCQQE